MVVKIVTDSVSDISPQIAEELGISIVPLNVHFGTDVYRDGIDLTSDQFYDMLTHSKVLPVTSTPTPQAVADVCDKLAEKTDEILFITISNRLSGTYWAVLQGVNLMKKKCRVEVIDSHLAIIAEGLLVIATAKAAQAGASLDDLVDITKHNMERIDLRATFDTLDYLKRGGRIGKAEAFLGSLLKINPIITLKDGVIEPAGRTRSWSKAIELMCNFVRGYSHIEELAVEDATTPADTDLIIEQLSSEFPKDRIYRSRPSAVIGTHTGPGLLVVAVLGDKD
jgi:DegV family protein with EDD domain